MKLLSSIASLSLLFARVIVSSAQPLPDTEIFLLDLKIKGEEFELGKPANITNRIGYDNQPHFMPDGSGLLFCSMQADSQTEVFKYRFHDKATIRITHTKDHEYSPTIMPDGKHFSANRIEADDSATQRLWKFDLDGTHPLPVLKSVKHTGYHCWYDSNTLVMFLDTRPPTLVVSKVDNEQTRIVTDNIGRSLHKIPGSDQVSFVHKENDSTWFIQQLDVHTFQMSNMVTTLPGSEDYVCTKEGILLMGKGSKLYKFNPKKDKQWQEVADFSKAGIREFNRIAIHPANTQIAIVGIKKE